MVASLKIADYPATLDLIDKTAKSQWKKMYYKTRDHVFQDLDDMIQSMWVVVIERNKAREIVSTGIEGNEGLLVTIIKRGLIDYVRSQVGKYIEDRKDSKKATYLFTNNYMDYTIESSGGIVDIVLEDTQAKAKIEEHVIQKNLQEQLNNFLSNRIKPRDLLIYGLVCKDEMTQKEVAKNMDITESRVNQICTKVKKQIEKDFGGKIRRQERSLGVW